MSTNFAQTIAALYKQAGLPQPSAAGVRYYMSKGQAGIDLLKRNLTADPRSTFHASGGAVDPNAPIDYQAQIDKLTQQLLPKTVSEGELSDRFGKLYDTSFATEEGDLTDDVTRQRTRFGEDDQRAAQLRSRERQRALAQFSEQQAAGGFGGGLAGEQLTRAAQPYDDQEASAQVTSSRFSGDIQRDEERRRREIQQRKAKERASYLADPNNRFEYSY